MHFISIDNRSKGNDGKLYIHLENGQKIIMPDMINRVPALLLIHDGYRVLYGEAINSYLTPKVEVEQIKATQNNMEPIEISSFSSWGDMSGSITSDHYSYLDQNPDDLSAKEGNGSMRQQRSYVNYNHIDNITPIVDENDHKKKSRMGEEITIDKLQQQRNNELQQMMGKQGPRF